MQSLDSGRTEEALEQMAESMKQAVQASNAMGDARYALQQMRSSAARAAGGGEYARVTVHPDRMRAGAAVRVMKVPAVKIPVRGLKADKAARTAAPVKGENR